MNSLRLILIAICTWAAMTTGTANEVTKTVLHATTSTSAYAHLVEVNDRWLYEFGPVDYTESIQFRTETERIQFHLREVLRQLSKRQITGLSAKQVAARQEVLHHLKLYAERKQFPLNTNHEERTPYFVDVEQTHCAVGYLLHATGHDNAVAAIQAQTNNGYVIQELDKHPALHVWAAAHGFSIDELAWIQPGYPGSLLLEISPFGSNLGVEDGQVLASAVTRDGDLFAAGDFITFDGESTEGFVRIVGEEIYPIASPFSKFTELIALPDTNLLLTVGIDFVSDSTQIAVYDATRGLFTYTYLFAPGQSLYVTVEGDRNPIIAVGRMREVHDPIDLYELNLEQLTVEPITLSGRLTGIVNDSYSILDRITLGGWMYGYDSQDTRVDSNQVTVHLSSSLVLPDDSAPDPNPENYIRPNLPVLRFYNTEAYTSQRTGISSVSTEAYVYSPTFDSLLYSMISYDEEDNQTVSFTFNRISYELWSSPRSINFHDLTHGILMTGNLTEVGSRGDVADTTRGVFRSLQALIVGTFYNGSMAIDGRIAGYTPIGPTTTFSDSAFVVGTYTSINGVALNQLAYVTSFVSDTQEPEPLKARVYYTQGHVDITLPEPLAASGRLFLYSSDGRLLGHQPLPAGVSHYRLRVATQQPVFHYAIEVAGRLQTGSLLGME